MLVLTRTLNEMLIIGDDITVKVLKVEGQQVTLGIEAPKSVAVYRNEVYENTRREPPPKR